MAQLRLDRIDFDIIRLLQKNARLSNKQIAAAVRLAPSTCHERIKKLQTEGVIRGAHADVDLRAVGLNLEALFFIKLAKYERSVVDRFIREIESIPEVRRAFLVSGRHDLIVHVAVKDIDHLRNLGFDHFASQRVVVNIETSIVFDSRTRNELPIFLDGVEMTKSFSGSKKARRRRSHSNPPISRASDHLATRPKSQRQ
jgi:DNA-binding Lrp family transcriptional regulator